MTTIQWSLLPYSGHYHHTVVITTIQWSLLPYSGHYYHTVVITTIQGSLLPYSGHLFYNQLAALISATPPRDQLVVLGNFSASSASGRSDGLRVSGGSLWCRGRQRQYPDVLVERSSNTGLMVQAS